MTPRAEGRSRRQPRPTTKRSRDSNSPGAETARHSASPAEPRRPALKTSHQRALLRDCTPSPEEDWELPTPRDRGVTACYSPFRCRPAPARHTLHNTSLSPPPPPPYNLGTQVIEVSAITAACNQRPFRHGVYGERFGSTPETARETGDSPTAGEQRYKYQPSQHPTAEGRTTASSPPPKPGIPGATSRQRRGAMSPSGTTCRTSSDPQKVGPQLSPARAAHWPAPRGRDTLTPVLTPPACARAHEALRNAARSLPGTSRNYDGGGDAATDAYRG
ncbi:wiskott-Aldrich syndrome protein homolog 1-like [Penaeus chinensis]|uniref:wiskott-Aldrich syndrome protein homolog 1-like n=1 Tax=Penaeus chinensis TaxID=139456 RepID=UPI001FB71DBE|nr:wiskott-Aldrich syndrome protein homolog 1-like [Penaeus chinensis]